MDDIAPLTTADARPLASLDDAQRVLSRMGMGPS
jgi:hypothetical protein